MSKRAYTIKKRIGNRWLQLYKNRFPQLRDAVRCWRKGHTFCPIHRGIHGDAFKLFDDADVTGGAVCNSCDRFSDGIHVIRWLTGWGFSQTLDFLEDWLQENGDYRGTKLNITPRKTTEPIHLVAEYIEETRKLAVSYHPRLKEYFQYRGLTDNLPRNIGFIENELYQDDTIQTYLPVMVTLSTAPDGTIVGVHRTYLDSDGPGKAKVKAPKKFFKALYPGALTGSAIRLYRHEGVIGVTEGIETAVAIAQATSTPMWATGGAHLLQAFIPPNRVRQVDIWADNDTTWVGQNAAIKLALRLIDAGIDVRLMIPPIDDTDWLEMLVTLGPEILQDFHNKATLFVKSTLIGRIILFNLLVQPTPLQKVAFLPSLKSE